MRLDDAIATYLTATLAGVRSYREGLKACCPYHFERTPSLFIYFDETVHNTWWFKCHGCGETGPVNKLLKKVGGFHLLLPEEKFLPTKVSKTLTVYRRDDTVGFPRDYGYFRTRGISAKTCRRFGFCTDLGGPAAIMPVYLDGLFQGSVRRNLDPVQPRYHISAGMDVSRILWGFDDVDQTKTVYVTEGIIDAACLWDAGYQGVALLSKESAGSKLSRLRDLCSVVYVPDNDKSGYKTARDFINEGIPVEFVPPGYKDVSEWRTGTKP